MFDSLNKRRPVLVIGLDGLSFDLLARLRREEIAPNMDRMAREGSLRRLKGVLPSVSPVSWATFATGVNPGRHGIYGFIERRPGSWNLFVPTSRDLRSETLWGRLSAQGTRVVVINVPLTYPPEPVNGVLVSGFSAADLESAVYPAEHSTFLADLGYKIDVDPWMARRDPESYLEEVFTVLERRRSAALHFLDEIDWDFFMVHFIETDRIYHFFWRQFEENDERWIGSFYHFHSRLDEIVGEIVEKAGDDCAVIVVSDHGFGSVKYEVNVNSWLESRGWLKLGKGTRGALLGIEPGSRAYSLFPGRVYIPVEGREPSGVPGGGLEYEETRAALAKDFLENLVDPAGCDPVLERVLMKEDLFEGPCADRAPDMVLLPREGYDLKGNLPAGEEIFVTGAITGMHTVDDAFILLRNAGIGEGPFDLRDCVATIMNVMGFDTPPEIEGHSLL